jgi:hypothetical protein
MRTLKILGILTAGVVLANCGGGGGEPGPVKGFLDVTLNTPNADDGAILLKVQGGEIDSVVGGAMAQYGGYTIQPSFTRIVVAGNITDGIVARVQVPDINNAGAYSATVEQVAVRNSSTTRSTAGYTLTVSAP